MEDIIKAGTIGGIIAKGQYLIGIVIALLHDSRISKEWEKTVHNMCLIL